MNHASIVLPCLPLLLHRRHAPVSPRPQFIANIEKRIDELEEEKAELAECQKLDRERRALEYLLANRALEKAREALEQVAAGHEQEAAEAERLQALVEEVRDGQAAVGDQVSEAKQEVRRVCAMAFLVAVPARS